MRPGGVRNSNAYTLSALAERAGAEVCGEGRVADDAAATRAAIEAALGADVVLISGGVSVGEHDHVKGALADLEVEESFWGVALKPGRPTWFGTRGADAGLRPARKPGLGDGDLPAARRAGAGRARRRRAGPAADDGEARRRLREGAGPHPRGALSDRAGEDGWSVEPTGAQGSHILTSMLGAECLALIPAEAGLLRAGDRVEVELIERLA